MEIIGNQELNSRDTVDFANAPVGILFRKMLIPTLLGMVSMVILNLADGAFVGHGAGSDALAAINIAAPIFTLMTGIGIMFGIGSSIVASIHLSQNNVKAANINITQAFIGSLIFTTLLSGVILSDLDGTCRLFGATEDLVELAGKYLRWICIFMPFQMLGMVGGFAVRLDGSPRYAMCCTLTASVLNIFLDWLFVFPLHMGLEGAAIATSIAFSVSAIITLVYVFFLAEKVKPYRLRLTLKSLALTIRNLGYQMKAGFPAMLGEIAISGMIVVGNFIFAEYLGTDGVAAFSVACYTTPIFFMLANAIVEASQPIISFAHGAGDAARLRDSRRLVLRAGFVAGIFSAAVLALGADPVTLMFLPASDAAYTLSVEGLPVFAIAAFFIPLNLVIIGYLQSIEMSGTATLLTLLRGFILVIPAFLLMPRVWGVTGIWLAVPAAEAACFLIAVLCLSRSTDRPRS